MRALTLIAVLSCATSCQSRAPRNTESEYTEAEQAKLREMRTLLGKAEAALKKGDLENAGKVYSDFIAIGQSTPVALPADIIARAEELEEALDQ
jgi:hypothetical protein